MNAISPATGSLAPFAARLAGLTDPARAAAAGALARTGLPGPRTEAWIYTNLRALSGLQFTKAPENFDEDAARAELAHMGLAESALPRIVFVNGRFASTLSVLPEAVGCVFASSNASTTTLASPDRDPMTALSIVLSEDGVALSVEAGVSAGAVLLVSIGLGVEAGDASPFSFHPRHQVTLGEGASLTLIEVAGGTGRYLHNPLLECQISEAATLLHVKAQRESTEAVHFATVYADVATRAAYDSFTMGLGGKLVRHEAHIHLGGALGAAHVNGVQVLGDRQVGDITSVIRHEAPDCISRQTVRNVLAGHARGVFQGKVYVARVAQKTDGYQMNQALLLSDTAEMNAKPELEIYADDVRCSHGATVGALDEEQLFYMRSRGVPETEARRILIEAFLVEVLDLITDDQARELLDATLATALEGLAEDKVV